jgi:flagellar biosynthetic protein FliQ
MNAETTIQFATQGLYMVLLLSLPTLLVALVVGVVISLLQAVTQVQEMTLTFVPKMIAVFLTLTLAAPWMTEKMVMFTRQLIQGIPGLIH